MSLDGDVLALIEDLPAAHRAQHELLLRSCQGLVSFNSAIPNNDAFVIFSRRRSVSEGLDEMRSQHAPLNNLNRNAAAAFESLVQRIQIGRQSRVTTRVIDLMRRWRTQVDLDNHYLGPKFAMEIASTIRECGPNCELPAPRIFDRLVEEIPEQVTSRAKLSAFIDVHSIGPAFFEGLECALRHLQFDWLEIQKAPLPGAPTRETIAISVFLSGKETPSQKSVNDLSVSLACLGCAPARMDARRAIRVGQHVLFCQGYNGLKDLLWAIGWLDEVYSAATDYSLRKGVVSDWTPCFSRPCSTADSKAQRD